MEMLQYVYATKKDYEWYWNLKKNCIIDNEYIIIEICMYIMYIKLF